MTARKKTYEEFLAAEERQREYMKEYNRRPEVKAARAARAKTPEAKAKAREWRQSEAGAASILASALKHWAKPESVEWLEWWNDPERMRAVRAGTRRLPRFLIQLESGQIVPRATHGRTSGGGSPG